MSRAVWLTGAAAILPIAAVCAAEALQPSGAFMPPAEPQILTRTLRHVMHDGQAVVTRRSYRLRFVAEGSGFRVEGELIDTAVEAPEWLSGIAELERRRPDPGMFPIRLDAAGAIVAAPTIATTPQQRRGIDLAAAQINRLSNLDDDDRTQAQSFVAGFREQHRTSWPLDLFRPAPGSRQDRRTVPLADGLRGQVTTEILANANSETGTLVSFERRVTTELADNRRLVIEKWTLQQAR